MNTMNETSCEECKCCNVGNITQGGFITVEKKSGRWFFCDGSGNPFISIGINHINYKMEKDRLTGEDLYHKTLLKQYADRVNSNYVEISSNLSTNMPDLWAKDVKSIMDSLGFNTVGAWSSIDHFKDDKYFIVVLYLSHAGWDHGAVQDFFSDEFYCRADEIARKEIVEKELYRERNLIGYCFDSEIKWSALWRKWNSMAVDYLNMPAEAPGKIRVMNLLRKEYSEDIERFNMAWKTKFKKWEDAYQFRKYTGARIGFKEDEDMILYFIADRYYKVCTEIIRKYDRNHMVMGDRLIGFMTPKSVLKAASNYLDVITVNNYILKLGLHRIIPFLTGNLSTRNCLQEFYKLTNKPILITEFGFRAVTENNPSTNPPIYPRYRSQKKRGIKTYNYIKKLMKKEYIVGYHIFQWCDQSKNGRQATDAENNNWGVVDVYNNIYEEYAGYLKKANFMILQRGDIKPTKSTD